MKVFISWSGDRSRLVAELLSNWIKCVLQATRPWISTRDIDRGALWFTEISEQLRETSIGIVCLTRENRSRPWILFEAGALAKGLSSSRVCTFLIDLSPTDLIDPLAQFNHTIPEQKSVWALVRTLNNGLGDGQLDERILTDVFALYWPSFIDRFKTIVEQTPDAANVKPRPNEEVLSEILSTMRMLNARMRRLEAEHLGTPPSFSTGSAGSSGSGSSPSVPGQLVSGTSEIVARRLFDDEDEVILTSHGLGKSWAFAKAFAGRPAPAPAAAPDQTPAPAKKVVKKIAKKAVHKK